MAVKTFYLLGSAAVSPGWFGQTQDGGSAPTAAVSNYGWTTAKVAVTTPYWRARLGASALATTSAASSAISGTTAPTAGTGATNTTAGDSFISPVTYLGNFPSGTWTLTFGMRCTVSSAQEGHMNFRVWAGANATGAGARELTAGNQIASTVTLAIIYHLPYSTLITPGLRPRLRLVTNTFFLSGRQRSRGSNTADAFYVSRRGRSRRRISPRYFTALSLSLN
jgi:hypothetical protein